MMTSDNREPYTPGDVLGAMVRWRVRGLPPDNRITLEANIERRFRSSFGVALYAVTAEQFESAIKHLCFILANDERTTQNTATFRMNAVIAHLVATVGHGGAPCGYAEYAALSSAFELARIRDSR